MDPDFIDVGSELIKPIGMTDFLLRLLINVLFVIGIIHFLYYRRSRRADYYFTFAIISLSTFMIVALLGTVKLKTGFALGLFAIFSIIRYRTESMPVREMTYLFIVLCLSVVNALASTMPVIELLLTNFLIVICVWMCEKSLKVVPCKLVQYDRIELIKPEKRKELIEDLKARTGLEVSFVEVGGIDFLRDMAVLKVYYKSNKVGNSVDNKVKIKQSEFAE